MTILDSSAEDERRLATVAVHYLLPRAGRAVRLCTHVWTGCWAVYTRLDGLLGWTVHGSLLRLWQKHI